MAIIQIGKKFKPYIIAEMSGNHNGSLNNAIKIVRAAADAGVSAIKLQTYTADTMTIKTSKKGFVVNSKNSIWKGYSLYNLYKKAHTPWSWHKKIFKEAKKLGLQYFSTPFDPSAIKFLKQFNLPIYKVASFENTDIRLIKLLAKTRKPLIISLGLATIGQIEEAVNIARKNGCKRIILLKCTSDYPAKSKDTNLNAIEFLKKKFKCEVGLSDHTKGIGVAIAAIAKGATVIEKHFTFDKRIKSVDSSFSLDTNEMKQLVIEANAAWEAEGRVEFFKSQSEKKNLIFRRSVYIVKNIKKGEKFTSKNLKCIRPGFGVNTKFYEKILNNRSQKNYQFGTPFRENDLKRLKIK
tara:strand:- start:103 stop:1155 length:1053 start_codon:yes stop_codon:yes gene_type:complete